MIGNSIFSKFKDFDIVTLSQLIAHGRNSCILKINYNGEEGTLIFKKGEVIDAVFQGLSGYQAARKLMILQGCDAEISPDNKKRRSTLKISVANLLLDEKNTTTEKVAEDNINKEDNAAIWGAYLQTAASISGFIWGSIINLKGEILKISSFDFASEAFTYASILENLGAAKEDCLKNFDIGLTETIQISTKKGAAFFAQCGLKDEYLLSFYSWEAPIESIPAFIYQIVKE